MDIIKEIEGYIEYFRDESNVFYCWSDTEIVDDKIAMGYVEYSKKLNEFIKFFYKADLTDYDYIKNFRMEFLYNIDEAIKEADIGVLKSILTYYIRGERFYEGRISQGVDNKAFLKVLEEMLPLLREEECKKKLANK